MSDFDPEAARAAHAWFDVDRVPRDPATTAWKRGARLAQARWRGARGYPIGAEPYRGGGGSTPVGSRLALAFADEQRVNFLSAGAKEAARVRLEGPREAFEMIRRERLLADLLSSMPLCFNLFGDLAGPGNLDAARRAITAWWPDAPTGEVVVRFEHSPGRRDRAFLGNQSAFDVAFEIRASDGSLGILGVETKYHEHAVVEAAPKPGALARYVEVTEQSGIFVEGWRPHIIGKALQQIWLDHLLVLAMRQHPSRRWTWGRFVLVHPAGNPSFASAATQYRALLRETSSFEVRTIEDLLGTPGAIAAPVADAFVERYLEVP